MKKDLDESGEFENPIVTEIVPFQAFYPAENYHHDYYENNRDKPYCTVVINPKISKLLAHYSQDVREEYLK